MATTTKQADPSPMVNAGLRPRWSAVRPPIAKQGRLQAGSDDEPDARETGPFSQSLHHEQRDERRTQTEEHEPVGEVRAQRRLIGGQPQGREA